MNPPVKPPSVQQLDPQQAGLGAPNLSQLPQPLVVPEPIASQTRLPDPGRGAVLPSYIVRGQIKMALPALNMYDVYVASMGLVVAQVISTTGGSNVFRPATTAQASMVPGTEVWVALDPVNNQHGFILGAANTSAPLQSYSQNLSQYPQVSGLEFDPKTSAARQLDAKVAAGVPAESAPNTVHSVRDVVPGDWSVTNAQGGGVGVESYRVWIGGGPMVGITFFCDEQTTRIAGSGLELITMAEEYEDRLMGRSLVSIRRRVDFPSDALFDNPPNLLEVRGQTYAGQSSFQSYRPKDNPAQKNDAAQWPDPQRFALIHEYRGVDGTYALTSAASLTLQKWVGVLMPIEVVSRPDAAPVTDFPGVVQPKEQPEDPNTFPAPEYTIPDRKVITGDKDLELISGEAIMSRNRSEASPLPGMTNAGNIIASIIGWQSARAFAKTDMWKLLTGQMPKFMMDGSRPREIDEINTDAGSWKRVPKFFAVNLNSYGASKRLYMGRAMISITDEGGIVLQDAWGSQIIMAGGNIYITAEHGIIRNAGKDNVDLSGRDHTMTAGRNTDIFASGGSATLSAGAQLSLIGGVSGDHGVLIHSKGTGSAMLMNGDTETYAAANGGIALRSEGGITADGKAIRLKAAKGAVGIKSELGVLVEAGKLSSAFTPTGMWLSDTEGGTDRGVMLSPYGSYMPLLTVTVNLVTFGMSNMLTNSNSQYAVYKGAPTDTLRSSLNSLKVGSTTPDAKEELYPGYLSSSDYGAETEAFKLPEPAWQTRIMTAGNANQMQKKYTWKINMSVNGQMPFPGKKYWESDKSGVKSIANYVGYGENYDHEAEIAVRDMPLQKMLRGL